jgi:ribonuclease HI
MRVFTDGACTHNGSAHAKAGYAVWFPEAKDRSVAARLPVSDPQTNQRAELFAIARATLILEEAGFLDEDVVVYTDSEYAMNCLTKWIPGWMARQWKTSAGGDVLHKDLIQETARRLAKFKSHRFIHVRAHTGGDDDLSRQNDIVDKMARGTIVEAAPAPPPATDVLFEGCPLQLLGPPVAQTQVTAWMRTSLDRLPKEIVDKYLLKAFTEACKGRGVGLTKQTLQKVPMLRAERMHLQIDRGEGQDE